MNILVFAQSSWNYTLNRYSNNKNLFRIIAFDRDSGDNSIINYFISSKPDCPGGGDESPLCNNDQCSINNGGCSHVCHPSPFGVLCLCQEGFHVRNTTNYKKCEGIKISKINLKFRY